MKTLTVFTLLFIFFWEWGYTQPIEKIIAWGRKTPESPPQKYYEKIYNESGKILQENDYIKFILIQNEYDTQGRLSTQIIESKKDKIYADYYYFSNPRSIVIEEGGMTSFQKKIKYLDAQGRVFSEKISKDDKVVVEKNTTYTDYDSINSIEEITFDEKGQKNNAKTQYKYNNKRQLIYKEFYGNEKKIYKTVEYHYKNGVLVAEIEYDIKQNNRLKTEYQYTLQKQLKQKIYWRNKQKSIEILYEYEKNTLKSIKTLLYTPDGLLKSAQTDIFKDERLIRSRKEENKKTEIIDYQYVLFSK